MNKNLMIVGAVIVLAGLGLIYAIKNQQNMSGGVSEPLPTAASGLGEVTPSALSETPTPVEQTSNEATIRVTTSGFEPQTVTVKAGTKVVWVNNSGQTVTVDSVVHPTHLVYPPLNLGEFGDGQSVSLVFDKAGSYRYHNHWKSSWTGTVIVE